MTGYLIRSALIVLAAWLAARWLGSSSAARRHLVWAVALGGLVALPLLRQWTPRWETLAAPVAGLAEATAPLRTVVDVTASRTGSLPVPGNLWLWIWMAGAAVVAARYARSQWAAARVVDRSEPIAGLPGVLLSDDAQVPMVCGMVRPVIVVPGSARGWTEAQLESVLAHERMHIERNDLWWHALAQAACALYWPQPLVWLAARKLRQECERAVDDGVLARGTAAPDYAAHLLTIARGLSGHELQTIGGIAMTRTSQLKSRIAAVLDPGINRAGQGRRFTIATATTAAVALLAVAAVEPPLLGQSRALQGVVRDASGAVIPNARVDVRSAGSDSVREIVYTNGAGEFSIANMADGAYDVIVEVPGFARLTQSGVKFTAGSSKPMDLSLQIGGIQERMQVTAQGTAAAPSGPPPAGTPTRIRVGGNVQASKMLKKVPPAYPAGAKADGAQGTVLLRAVIGLSGQVLSVEPINKQVDGRLVESATDAVKQWQYSPTLLNGVPVEVITVVEVNYTLAP